MSGDLLFLCHRIPYPPDKGEKIRAWHVLAHLARRWRIHLGCLADEPPPLAHITALREVCADVLCLPVGRRLQRARGLWRARAGAPLSVGCFDDARLHRWVASKVASGAATAFAYSAAMAPYVLRAAGLRRRVLDMVDVDSEKWRAYAARGAWPRRLLCSREARTLLAFERQVAAQVDRTLFVSEAEAARFVALAPELAQRVGWIDNGVDLDRFAPGRYDDPLPPGRRHVVFTGTMDYRPNIDAVAWFAAHVLPLLPDACFTIVGANPAAEVRRLAALPGVVVTGRVADVRPYLAHAAAVVAPLRIARGIQNKVLEAMAIGRPVVASLAAFEGIDARPGRDLLVADGAAAMAARVGEVLRGEHPGLGAAARTAMQRRYAWDHVLAGLDAVVDPAIRWPGEPMPAEAT